MSTVHSVSDLFEKYATELEAEYDLHENLVKKSREITYESKKIIFLLHRVENKEKGKNILHQAKERLRKVFLEVTNGIGSLLRCEEVFKFIRAFRPGIEEFVEAASFYYYLMFDTLVSFPEMCEGTFLLGNVHAEGQSEIIKGLNMSEILTFSDYVLGILDLTGELMRKCIGSKNFEEPFLLRNILRGIAISLNNVKMNRDMKRKYFTLKDNLMKVEKVCYSIKVRTAEMKRIMAVRHTNFKFEDYQNIIESAFTSQQESTFDLAE